jgi:hypothetical protein
MEGGGVKNGQKLAMSFMDGPLLFGVAAVAAAASKKYPLQ